MRLKVLYAGNVHLQISAPHMPASSLAASRCRRPHHSYGERLLKLSLLEHSHLVESGNDNGLFAKTVTIGDKTAVIAGLLGRHKRRLRT